MSTDESTRSRAVSPVVAVILLVAITVALSAVVGAFALNLGQSTTDQQSGTAGVSITSSNDGTATVQLVASGNSDKVIVRDSAGNTENLTSVGDTITVNTGGEAVTILSVSNGKKAVIRRYEPSNSSYSSLVVDAFDDGEASAYTEFQTGTYWEDSAGKVQSGGSLKLADTNDAGSYGVESLSGLPRYPQAGDTWEVWTYMPNEPYYTYHIGFGKNSDGHGYMFTHQARDDVNDFKLTKYNGTSSTLFNANFDYSQVKGEWVRVEFAWATNGDITVTMYDENGTELISRTGTDDEFTSGGVSWGVNNVGISSTANITFVYDEARITEP